LKKTALDLMQLTWTKTLISDFISHFRHETGLNRVDLLPTPVLEPQTIWSPGMWQWWRCQRARLLSFSLPCTGGLHSNVFLFYSEIIFFELGRASVCWVEYVARQQRSRALCNVMLNICHEGQIAEQLSDGFGRSSGWTPLCTKNIEKRSVTLVRRKSRRCTLSKYPISHRETW